MHESPEAPFAGAHFPPSADKPKPTIQKGVKSPGPVSLEMKEQRNN